MTEINENFIKPVVIEHNPKEIKIPDFKEINIDVVNLPETKDKIDMLFDDNEECCVEKRTTINQDLKDKEHAKTGVPFEEQVVETDEGKLVEVVVPKFDSITDVKLPEDLEMASDKKQFEECNKKLKEAVEKYPELKEQFDEEQLEQISDGETPDGYTWHHDAEKGKMQLVDSKTHGKTAHTGGKSIWGGGSNNR